MEETLQLVECPRDAMQGWKPIIPTQEKISYLNSLLKVGFHTIDMGSFVSPKLIPQMADTAEVISGIDATVNDAGLLAIVANVRGAEQAISFSRIRYLGFPFSISATFQHRNTNSSPEESLLRVRDMQSLCVISGKQLVVYMSMGFGNPYGDPYSEELLGSWMKKIVSFGVQIVSLADTVGVATPQQVSDTVRTVIPMFPETTIGVHLHSHPEQMLEKLDAAYLAGCRRFDGAINGVGGCPMADDDLVGNMDTIKMVQYFKQKGHLGELQTAALEECRKAANEIFI
jgi:hydroxymethylglutaryl-CoA lyase